MQYTLSGSEDWLDIFLFGIYPLQLNNTNNNNSLYTFNNQQQNGHNTI